MRRLKKQSKSLDKRLLVLALVLTFIGLVFLADASAPLAEREFNDKFFFVKQQISWAFVGIIAMFIFAKIHFSFWYKTATVLFLFSLILLIVVFIPGFGAKFLGAKRWIFIGTVSIQPSEIIKLTLAMYLAKIAAKGKKPWAFLLPIGLVSFLIMLQPDLGTTLIVAAVGFSQMFISGINLVYFFGSIFAGVVLSFMLIITSDYRRDRLLTFLSQTQDPLGKSYHIRQILYALGSGGLFGVGLGQSRQKYLFLPETATDSIFAVIAEETGFLATSLLIIIFAVFTLRMLRIARRAPDVFSNVFATGIAAWIGGQVFLNIASMVALVPLTGIPLPFISYGGSSLVTVLAACGILLNISQNAKTEK